MALPLMALVACTPSENKQSGDDLRSDLPLRSIKYLADNPKAAEEIEAMCKQWKSSQRPISSWPAVVAENCNNANAARYRNIQAEQRENMKRQIGI
jgi:hypothetical protein